MPSVESRRSKTSILRRAGLTLGIAAAALELTAPGAFVGSRALAPKPLTAINGYRFDWMLEKRNGEEGLQTADGWWLGEVGFEKAQGALGLRYRMRPTAQEYKEGTEVDGLMWQLGPFKLKGGEIFGGTGNNEELRQVKRKLAAEGLTDPKKLEENEYWKKRYGHERWGPAYVDQSTGLNKGFLRGLSAWSGCDPLKEERGVTWFEADYGKPWLKKYAGRHLPGFVTTEQLKKEYNDGKLLNQ